MKVYIKLFLAAAIPYSLALSLLFRSPILGTVLGVFFGVLIAGVFGTLQVHSMQGKKRADASYAVHQTREIEIDVPLDQALVLARAALQSIAGVIIKPTPTAPHKIEARTGLNWETYGERITLSIAPLDADTTTIRIESRPRLRTTLIDYGRNLHYVNAISQFLREHTAADHLSLKDDQALMTDETQHEISLSMQR